MRAWQKLNRFPIDFSQPQFRAGKISHDRYAPAGFARCVTDAPNNFRVFRRVPVGKIQPRDVESRANEPHQHLG
jgi:hypothetical protein